MPRLPGDVRTRLYAMGRVKLACYRFNESDADRTLAEKINAALAEIRYR